MLIALLALATSAGALPALPDAPPCTRGIGIALVDPSGDFNGMSHAGAYLTVRNRGPRACRLAALPKVRLTDAHGVVISAMRAAPTSMHPGPVAPPVVLGLGERATAELRWISGDVYDGGNCATPARVTVTFGALALKARWSGGQICGPGSKPLPFSQTPLRAGPIPAP